MKSLGAMLRDEGMNRALKNAEANSEEWFVKALAVVKEFCEHRQYVFSENVIKYASIRGLSKAPDNRAWGSVMTKAARLGYITKDGYDVSHNAKAHCRPVTKWKSNLFEQKS